MKLNDQINELKTRFGMETEQEVIKACVATIYFHTGDEKGLTKEAEWMQNFLNDCMSLYKK